MIYIIGLGLGSWVSIPLEGYKIIERVNKIFIERYTSPFDFRELEIQLREEGKEVIYLNRVDIEDIDRFLHHLSNIRSKDEHVALLTPGDPLIATTHQYLIKELTSRGFKVKVVHAASILSAAIGESGLHVYKFGPIATVMRSSVAPPTRALRVLVENMKRNLHTLLLLEYNFEENYIMTPYEGMSILDEFRKRLKINEICDDTYVIAISKLGEEGERKILFKWNDYHKIIDVQGPAVLIIPAKLHFTEHEYIMEVLERIE